jgi:hypothetical protein
MILMIVVTKKGDASCETINKFYSNFRFGKLGYNWNADDADWADLRGFFPIEFYFYFEKAVK